MNIKELRMRELRTEVKIKASIERVWEVLVDFGNWNEWNPTVKEINGESSIGSKLMITMIGEDCKEMTYQSVVLQLIPPKIFRWRAKMLAGFIFKNDRVFELEEKEGQTILVHKEEYSGLMVPISWNKISQFALPVLEKMNEALKNKIEKST